MGYLGARQLTSGIGPLKKLPTTSTRRGASFGSRAEPGPIFTTSMRHGGLMIEEQGGQLWSERQMTEFQIYRVASKSTRRNRGPSVSKTVRGLRFLERHSSVPSVRSMDISILIVCWNSASASGNVWPRSTLPGINLHLDRPRGQRQQGRHSSIVRNEFPHVTRSKAGEISDSRGPRTLLRGSEMDD